MTGPRFPHVGVLALVPDRWGPEWQARHHVMSRLARHFQVLWVNPALGWRERSDPETKGAGAPGRGSLPEGFETYTPEAWLPLFYRPKALARWTLGMRLRRARARLRSKGVTRVVLYVWRPEFASALTCGPYDVTVYHIDDEYSFSPVDLPTSEVERALIAAVDQVIIHSPGLLEKKGHINSNTELVPNGVEYERFAADQAEPALLAEIPSPRIGYIGVLKRTLDWSLLRFLSDQQPDWNFVLMGPTTSLPFTEGPIAELRGRPNVHVLPAVPSDEVGPYPQHLDVCILPYQADDYGKYLYPLKLHEYLAGGRPVVGTRIRSLEDFSDVVGLASTQEEWLAAIDRALQADEQSLARVEARREVARAHDWEFLVYRIARCIATRLGGEVASSYPEVGGVREMPPHLSSTSATPPPYVRVS